MRTVGANPVDVDPYSAFRKNSSTIRVEINGLFHVRNADGALLIEADPPD